MRRIALSFKKKLKLESKSQVPIELAILGYFIILIFLCVVMLGGEKRPF